MDGNADRYYIYKVGDSYSIIYVHSAYLYMCFCFEYNYYMYICRLDEIRMMVVAQIKLYVFLYDASLIQVG